MENTQLQTATADDEENSVGTKRPASEDPSAPSDTDTNNKRVKTSHDDDDGSTEGENEPPPKPYRVPFPDKVRPSR